MHYYIFSFINHKFWEMLFIVNVFADSVCVVFASPLTLLFALLCEHVSKTPKPQNPKTPFVDLYFLFVSKLVNQKST